MEDPPWKKIKLSLERPYKYDDGELIPVLQDITPEGIHINEPYVDFKVPRWVLIPVLARMIPPEVSVID
jgi:hypothetical protein